MTRPTCRPFLNIKHEGKHLEGELSRREIFGGEFSGENIQRVIFVRRKVRRFVPRFWKMEYTNSGAQLPVRRFHNQAGYSSSLFNLRSSPSFVIQDPQT
jgi:hypothetical protein